MINIENKWHFLSTSPGTDIKYPLVKHYKANASFLNAVKSGAILLQKKFELKIALTGHVT